MRSSELLCLIAILAQTACSSSGSKSEANPPGPSEEPTIVVSGQSSPSELLHDSGKLYFLTQTGSGQALSAISDQGGAVETLAQNAGPFALYAGDLYFYDGAAMLMKLPVAGGTATTLVGANLDTVTSVAADASGAYWTSHDSEFYGRVEALPPGVAEPIPVSGIHTDPTHLVLDETWVYFEASGKVSSAEKQSGTELLLATSTAEAIALDDANVYWATIHNGSIRSVPKQGGETKLLQKSIDHPRDVAVDSSHVYFTVEGARHVARISKASGKLELLAIDQDSPYDLALSEDRVFWTNRGTGAIASVHK